MKKIIEFLKGSNAPLFGLLAMVFGLFQMYAKTYYAINPMKMNIYVDVSISLIVAFGFSLATTIIIIHTKKKDTPILFAIFDFLGYMLFFSNNFATWYIANDWAKIIGAFFVSGLSAVIIYYFGEIFISEIREKSKESNLVKSMQNDFDNQLHLLEDELSKSNEELNYSNELLNNLSIEFNHLSELNKQYAIDLSKSKEELDLIRIELNKSKEELTILNEQKSTFIVENDPIKLRERLKGLKASYTRCVKEERFETANELKSKIRELSDVLGVEVSEKYAYIES